MSQLGVCRLDRNNREGPRRLEPRFIALLGDFRTRDRDPHFTRVRHERKGKSDLNHLGEARISVRWHHTADRISRSHSPLVRNALIFTVYLVYQPINRPFIASQWISDITQISFCSRVRQKREKSMHVKIANATSEKRKLHSSFRVFRAHAIT